MSKRVVIPASSSNQSEVKKWVDYWTARNCQVINYSRLLDKNKLNKQYPVVFKDFYESITKADILFVANYDKNGIEGYIGAAVFSEMTFAIARRLLNNQKIEIILSKMPSDKIQAVDEIKMWLELGWIRLLDRS